jgi:sugar lactone lactonase YvrE
MMRTVAGWLVIALATQSALAQRVIATFAGTDVVPIAGGVPATSASISVNTVNADRAGNFYICDEFQSVVFKVDQQNTISVIAGNGIQTFSGDGGLAVNASLNEPQGVAVDPAGNVFISDSFNHRIRKIDTQGIITTVAGNGQAGFSGDGGPAAQASLNRPYRIALDSTGNLYIVDSLNDRIRKVDPSGIITTVAGTGQSGFSGDGGAATQAQLGNPVGIAVGPDDLLYVADKDNNRVRKVDARGVISTIAGTGAPGFSGDGGQATAATFNLTYGVAFDSGGNLFVVDYVNDRIRRIDTAGVITTVAGNGQRGFAGDGGAATSAPLEFPFSADIDSSDRLLISDTFNNRIRLVSQGIISTVAGNGKEQNPGTTVRRPAPSSTGRAELPSTRTGSCMLLTLTST